jgi:hypothetical protein
MQRRQRNNSEQDENDAIALSPKRACTAGRLSITPPLSVEEAPRMSATQFYLSGGPTTSSPSDHRIANPASDENIQRNTNDHFLDTESVKLPFRLKEACDRCHRMKTKCRAPFPCQKCTKSGSKCVGRRKTLKRQNTLSQQSPFRTTTSFAIPTAVPNL